MLDYVGRHLQPIDLADFCLQSLGCAAVDFISQHGIYGAAQALNRELPKRNYDPCLMVFNAGGDARLIVAQRNGNQRYTFSK